MATKKHSHRKLGLGFAAIAIAAAAGGYFLYGKGGTKRRKVIRGWALKAKGEVLEKIEGLKYISKEDYKKIVDTVLVRYKKLKSVNAQELEQLSRELKSHWNSVSRDAVGKAKRNLKKIKIKVKKVRVKVVPKRKNTRKKKK